MSFRLQYLVLSTKVCLSSRVDVLLHACRLAKEEGIKQPTRRKCGANKHKEELFRQAGWPAGGCGSNSRHLWSCGVGSGRVGSGRVHYSNIVSHLVLAPGDLADVRVEVVVPALAALLPGPAGELGGDAAPLLGTDLPDELGHAPVVLGGPGALRAAVEHLGPPVEALHVRLSRDALGHLRSREGGRERRKKVRPS